MDRLYQIMNFIDNICEIYENNNYIDNNVENNTENNKDNDNNIRNIRNILNIRNINQDYNNNRNIISNLFGERENVVNNSVSDIITLFTTNYIHSIQNNIENEKYTYSFYSGLKEELKKNDNCSICFEQLDNNNLLIVTKCNHIYHEKCMNKWFMLNKTCPLCRSFL